MKPIRILFLFAALLASAFAVPPERVVLIRGTNLADVKMWLDRGWTIKHQALSSHAYGFWGVKAEIKQDVYMLFTLSCPTGAAFNAEEIREQKEEYEMRMAYQMRREKALAEKAARENKIEKP